MVCIYTLCNGNILGGRMYTVAGHIIFADYNISFDLCDEYNWHLQVLH
jgi:hypothetical protein